MRFLVLQDKTIDKDQSKEVGDEFIAFYQENTGIKPTFKVLQHDYSTVEGSARVYFDSLPYGYLKENVDRLYKKYAKEFDHVLFWVHRHNFN